MEAKTRRASILKRLVLLFVILVIPIVTVGIFLQLRTTSKFQDDIVGNVSEIIDGSIHDVDSTITSTNQHAFNVLANSRVLRLSNPNDPMSAYERVINVNFVRDMLTNIQFSDPYISNIRLYFPALSVYYNVGYFATLDYLEKKSQGEMTSELYQELLSYRESSHNPHLRNDNLTYLQYSSVRNPRIIIEAVYTRSSLEAMFEKTLQYNDSLYFFTLDGSDFSVTNSPDTDWTQFSFSPGDPITVRLHGDTWYAFTFTTETNGTYTQLIAGEHLSDVLNLSTYYIIIFSAVVIIFLSIFIFVAFHIVHTPVKLLSDNLNQIEGNTLGVQLEMPKVSDFDYVYQCFNNMSSRIKLLIEQQLEQETLLNRAQLKQLQAQINPHFLYNSFFMLSMMIEREMNDEATELAKELGSYFRYITRNVSDEATLQDEYEHTRVYAHIQLKRFSGKMRMQMDELPAELRGIVVPRLILQPIMENTYNYGMEQKTHDGFIRFCFVSDRSSVTVITEDNGDCLTDETLEQMQENLRQLKDGHYNKEYTGLYNLCKRLMLFYKKDDIMELSRSALGGLKISVKLYRQEVQ